MFSEQSKFYVFRQGEGKIPVISYQNDHSLQMGITDRTSFIKNVSLAVKGVGASYSCDMDDHGIIHSIFQDNIGTIYYQTLPGSYAVPMPILTSREPTPQSKYLQLFCYENKLCIFYVLKHGERNLLACQVVSGQSVKNPIAVDYISQDNYGLRPYSVIHDGQGNFKLIYTRKTDVDEKIICRNFMVSNLTISPPEEINIVCSDKILYPRGIRLKDGRSLICHTAYDGKMSYPIISLYNGEWKNVKISEEKTNSFGPFYTVLSDGLVIVYSVSDKNVIYFSQPLSELGTDKNNWNYKYTPLTPSNQPVSIVYKSLHPDEKKLEFSEMLPGYLIGGLKLFFYNPMI